MRRLEITSLAIVASMSLLIACDSDRRDKGIDADQAAIKTLIGKSIDAFVARDWDEFVGTFSEDAVWMPPGSGILRGQDAWWSFVQPWWNSSAVIEIDITTEELIVSGDWAIERHSEFQVFTIGDNPEPITAYFKAIWVFQRQVDGTWKISRYIWNESPPPA